MEGATEVTIIATEWGFEPKMLTLHAGEPVTIVLVNNGLIEHEVELPAFGLHLHTPAGATMRASFVPDKTGTFEFACEILGHRLAGMTGTVAVIQ